MILSSMGVLEKTEREPDFKKDVEESKFAEEDFKTQFFSKPQNLNKTLFDVSNIKEYQKKEIDFVIDNEGAATLDCIDNVLSNNSRYKRIEVKANGRALDTGKIAFEFNSHGKLGWGLTTKCDWMYTVFVKKNTSDIIKRGWINMGKWKQWVLNSDNAPYMRINKITNENITDVLCDLQELEKKNVIKFV